MSKTIWVNVTIQARGEKFVAVVGYMGGGGRGALIMAGYLIWETE